MDTDLLTPAPKDDGRAALRSDAVYGTTLLCWCLDYFGPECLGTPDEPSPWHPKTWKLALAEHGLELTDHNFDKLMAAVTVLTTDLFFKSAYRFAHLTEALTGGGLDPGTYPHPDAQDMAWAVTEALLLVPPDEDPEPFSDEVRHYIGRVLFEEGFVRPPDVLGIALGVEALTAAARTHDPVTLAAAREAHDGRCAAVTETLREGLAALLGQLAALRLSTGKTDEIQKRLRAALAA